MHVKHKMGWNSTKQINYPEVLKKQSCLHAIVFSKDMIDNGIAYFN